MFKCRLICINTVQLPAESMKTQGCKCRDARIHAGTFAPTLTPCCIADDSSLLCNGSEIYIKVVFSRWAAKCAQTQGHSILQREGFSEGKWGEGWNRIGGFPNKGRHKKWEVCISLDLSELGNVLDLCLSALQTPFCCDTSLLLSSLYSDTENERKPLKC